MMSAFVHIGGWGWVGHCERGLSRSDFASYVPCVAVAMSCQRMAMYNKMREWSRRGWRFSITSTQLPHTSISAQQLVADNGNSDDMGDSNGFGEISNPQWGDPEDEDDKGDEEVDCD